MKFKVGDIVTNMPCDGEYIAFIHSIDGDIYSVQWWDEKRNEADWGFRDEELRLATPEEMKNNIKYATPVEIAQLRCKGLL